MGYVDDFWEMETINETIIRVMRSFGYVGSTTPEDKVLRAYNHLVRNYIPLVLESNLSKVDVPYRLVLLISQANFWIHVDRALALVKDGAETREVLAYSLITVATTFASIPLVFSLAGS